MNRSCLTQTGLVLLLVASTFCPALHAGCREVQHVISAEADGVHSVAYPADSDGDGDLDVVSAYSDYDFVGESLGSRIDAYGKSELERTIRIVR